MTLGGSALGAHLVEQAHEALKGLEERWASRYPDVVTKWLEKSYSLLEFLSHPKRMRAYLYTTNQLKAADEGGEEEDEGGGGVLRCRSHGEAFILGVGVGE